MTLRNIRIDGSLTSGETFQVFSWLLPKVRLPPARQMIFPKVAPALAFHSWQLLRLQPLQDAL